MESLFFVFQFLAQFLVFFLVLLRGRKPTKRFPAVANFDFKRFSGTWYVAAHVPSPFKPRLTSVTTTYSCDDDGSVRLLTRGWDVKKKTWRTEESVGHFHHEEEEGWFDLDCENPFHQTRKVIYLDEDYSQAIIVGLVMRSVWIVYRDPNAPKHQVDALMARAAEMGFRVKRISSVDQSKLWEETGSDAEAPGT